MNKVRNFFCWLFSLEKIETVDARIQSISRDTNEAYEVIHEYERHIRDLREKNKKLVEILKKRGGL